MDRKILFCLVFFSDWFYLFMFSYVYLVYCNIYEYFIFEIDIF